MSVHLGEVVRDGAKPIECQHHSIRGSEGSARLKTCTQTHEIVPGTFSDEIVPGTFSAPQTHEIVPGTFSWAPFRHFRQHHPGY